VTVAILPQILAMADSLQLEVVVEGVETDQQANYFSTSKAKLPVYGQGWLYGRPVTAEEFHDLLAAERDKAFDLEESPAPWIARPGAIQVARHRVA
jgi:sensor c-di-GMP phosphodiesterase-like protein